MIHGDSPAKWRSGDRLGDPVERGRRSGRRLDRVNLHELDWTLGRHRDLMEHLFPMTFLTTTT